VCDGLTRFGGESNHHRPRKENPAYFIWPENAVACASWPFHESFERLERVQVDFEVQRCFETTGRECTKKEEKKEGNVLNKLALFNT
jgi:hypothetical protein